MVLSCEDCKLKKECSKGSKCLAYLETKRLTGDAGTTGYYDKKPNWQK